MDKACKKCGVVKPLDDFYQTTGTRDGHRGDCKTCNLAEKARRHAANPGPARERTRAWNEVPENWERSLANHARYKDDGRKALSNRRHHLKKKYGITIEEYDGKLAEQGGVCKICGREPRPDISLHVDHDHVTGKIRGLLCFRCNVAIGLISEDWEHLRSIERYFHAHDPESVRVRAVVLERIQGLKRPA